MIQALGSSGICVCINHGKRTVGHAVQGTRPRYVNATAFSLILCLSEHTQTELQCTCSALECRTTKALQPEQCSSSALLAALTQCGKLI